MYTDYESAIDSVDTFAPYKKGSIISQGNEVIVPASGETAEEIARASAVRNSGIILGGDLNIIRPYANVNPVFLALAISTGFPCKELARRAQGKTIVHIHNADIQSISISIPLLEEQKRIANVFLKFDSLLALHQREWF